MSRKQIQVRENKFKTGKKIRVGQKIRIGQNKFEEGKKIRVGKKTKIFGSGKKI